MVISRDDNSAENRVSRVAKCFLTNFGLILGEESFPRKGLRFYASVAFFGAAICLVYGNVITSLAIIPTPPFMYNSFGEIVAANFKILFVDPYHIFRTEFISTFRYYGYSESDLNNTAQILENVELVPTWLAKTGEQRYCTELDTSTIDYQKSLFANEIESIVFNEGRNYSVHCHNIKEHYQTLFLSWSVFTVNRHWIMKSMQRMHDAGLRELWRRWSLWAAMNDEHLLSELHTKDVHPPDIITIQKLLAVIILCSGTIVVAGLIFAFEVLMFWFRQVMAKLSDA